MPAAETESGDYPGLEELRLVTDVTSVEPGKPFTVGLWIRHEEKFHTYWKNPGIVGIATMFKWELPEGWQTSEILWPTPQKTIMATLTAWGYEGDGTCLLVTVTPPEEIEDDEVTLKTRVGWMACARTCHPGWHDFELELPVSEAPGPVDAKWAAVFDEVRESQPEVPPQDWELAVGMTDEEVEGGMVGRLEVALPSRLESTETEIYFFSYDNQVDSDSPQTIAVEGGAGVRLEFVYPDFGPDPKPGKLEGLLYCSDGWPGIDSEWVEISVPWSNDMAVTNE